MAHTAQILTISTLPVGVLLLLAVMTGDAEESLVNEPVAPAPTIPAVLEMTGELEVSAALDRSLVLQEDGRARVEVTIRSTHEPSAASVTPTDLVVVLDRSGSMSGRKIADAKAAVAGLLDHLSPQDRFSLVTYESSAHVAVPLSEATAGNVQEWNRLLRRISVGGGTEMQEGLATGQAMLSSVVGRAQRVILISDGLPNSPEGLMEQAAGMGRRGLPLTTIGIGADYDEQLMAGMADAGTGNFYWVQGSDDLAATFASEFDTARETVANGLAVTYTAPGAVSLVEAAGYPLTESDAGASFAVGSLFAGQERTFWLTLNVDDVNVDDVNVDDVNVDDVNVDDVNRDMGTIDPGTLTVSWTALDGQQHTAQVDLPSIEVTQDLAAYQAGFDSERWGRGVVDEAYNQMRAQVSAQVQAGDQDAALALLDGYYAEQSQLNEALNNEVVTDNLDTIDELRAEVVDNFTGTDQRARRNLWSKSNNVTASQSRRSGQYRN